MNLENTTQRCTRGIAIPGEAESKVNDFIEGAWHSFSIWGKSPSYWLDNCDMKMYPMLVNEAKKVITKALGQEIVNALDIKISEIIDASKSNLENFDNLITGLKDILYIHYKRPLSDKNIDHMIDIIAINNSEYSTNKDELFLESWKSKARVIFDNNNIKTIPLTEINRLVDAIKEKADSLAISLPETVEDYIMSLDTNPESLTTSGLIWIKDKLDYFSVILISILDKPVAFDTISGIIFSSV